MKACLDSSAFAKRFVDESGSDAVEAVCTAASELGLCVLRIPEVTSALNRRLRERLLTPSQYRKAKQRLLEDVRDVDVIQLTPSVIGLAIQILEASPVRAMDALHISCAIEWGADVFVSADARQIAAARRAGLKTKQT
jgi:hypothetical protein